METYLKLLKYIVYKFSRIILVRFKWYNITISHKINTMKLSDKNSKTQKCVKSTKST